MPMHPAVSAYDLYPVFELLFAGGGDRALEHFGLRDGLGSQFCEVLTGGGVYTLIDR